MGEGEVSNPGSEEGGARVARSPLLVFAVFLMVGVDTLHGTTTDAPYVDLDTPSVLAGTLEGYGCVQVGLYHYRRGKDSQFFRGNAPLIYRPDG